MNKLTEQQLETYWDVIDSRKQPDGQRFGQWLFNVLYELYPDYADTIRGTHVDPFYDSKRVWQFTLHISNID